MIKVTKLKKYFQSPGQIVKAVDGVDLSISDGVLAAIVGKSGSGKSTLLSLLGALDRPDEGEIKINDQDIAKLSEGQQTAYRCRQVGFIFQFFNLIPNLSALENVMLPMEFAGVGSQARRERAQELLEEVGLAPDKQRRQPNKLSGGEQQRVAIARALANRPKLILADEPTGNLDAQTGESIIKLLSELAQKQKTTVIIVTHDQTISKRADRVFRLSDGKINQS